MKPIKKIIPAILAAAMFCSCSNMDLSPLDKVATGNWYQTPEQFEIALNAFLLHQYWPVEKNEWAEGTDVMCMEEPTDDWTNRQTLITFTNGSISGNATSTKQMYKFTTMGIARANTMIHEVKQARERNDIDSDLLDLYEANARFYRACFYSRFIMLYGDAILWEEMIDFEDAYNFERTDRFVVLEHVYEQFDLAADILPVEYRGSDVKRATKGAAYAMKARLALHYASIFRYDEELRDEAKAARHYGIARDAAWDCMELNAYSLHDNFGELFIAGTKNSPEGIITLPRSKQHSGGITKQYLCRGAVKSRLPRLANSGVGATATPSWDLLCSFLCIDGLPIDESPLYDPLNPFKNRDPRCTYTIVEFGTEHIGVIYQPRFDETMTWSFRENKMIPNLDNRAVETYASYNGLILRKGIDEDWLGDFEVEPDKMVMRYAEVLMTYAEAKIELNDVDDTVLDAMNLIRDRAYKDFPLPAGVSIPKITETDQDKLRTILRFERRMEFAFEGVRLYDLYRWRIAEKVMNRPNYGIPLDANQQKRILDNNVWFIGGIPQIDGDACVDFAGMQNLEYYTRLSTRVFDKTKHYLWPLPTDEVLNMPNVEQNPNY